MDMDTYLDGRALYGDDFGPGQIAEWLADERDGYADLAAKDPGAYRYVYHALNRYHAYRYLPAVRFGKVLGFGSAFGDELLPIISQVDSVTVVEVSDVFVRNRIHNVPATYLKPSPCGRIPLADNTFDLITCFGVLHHIPNVSFVVAELARTLKAGGYLLIREPIVSMGDWTKPRPGLTKRERGIPLQILRAIIQRCELDVAGFALCDFPIVRVLFRLVRKDVYNSSFATWFDAKLASAFGWNLRYHACHGIHRLRPGSASFVLRKPA
jgi:SAM-dependent methyltransferase